MHMRQTQSFHSINQARAYKRSRTITKVLTTTIYMGEILLIYGSHLEILIGGRLHDVCSSFVFKVIITRVGVGVIDDDLVVRASGIVVFYSRCWSSHEYSDLLD